MDDTKYGPIPISSEPITPDMRGVRSTINETLNDRSKTHGPFSLYSECAQALRSTVPVFSSGMSDVEAEGLNQIMGKIARILTGDSSFKDHWHDIAGYAEQVERHLFNTKL